MNKIMYVGPTIYGVATRNTVYDELPQSLKAARSDAPFLGGLCVPLNLVPEALRQIRTGDGAYNTLYNMALEYSANKLKGA